jgi:nucleotide-binding universal stress UspA family protein
MPTRQVKRRSERLKAQSPARSAAPARSKSAGAPAPVLVATDGSRIAHAAIRLASLMAERGAWAPQAVTVFEPLPVSVADMTLAPPAPIYYETLMESAAGLVQRQVRRYGGATWNLLVEFGRSAPTITRLAKEQGARIIVIGLGRHGKLARLFGAETATRVARQSDVPVLAVAGSARELPRTALVAMDFGESSVRAAREAIALLQPGGRLHLLHVRWAMNGETAPDTDWERTYALGVEQGFKRLVHQLGHDNKEIEITTELRLGKVIETTLKVAKEIDADVIAVGSHNQSFVDRMVIGFTPAYLLRAARCSVLVAPPVKGAD